MFFIDATEYKKTQKWQPELLSFNETSGWQSHVPSLPTFEKKEEGQHPSHKFSTSYQEYEAARRKSTGAWGSRCC